jgi:hypothetical protein
MILLLLGFVTQNVFKEAILLSRDFLFFFFNLFEDDVDWWNFLIAYLAPSSKGLDIGCGPGAQISKYLESKGKVLDHIRVFFFIIRVFFSPKPYFSGVGQIFCTELFFYTFFFYNFFVKYPFTLQKLCFTILRNSK